MKKIFLKLNMAIIFLVVLFAGTVFADDFTLEDYNAIEKAIELINSEGTILDTTGNNVTKNYAGATVYISSASLKELEEKYGIEIFYGDDAEEDYYNPSLYIKKGESYLKVNLSSKDGKQEQLGIVEGTTQYGIALSKDKNAEEKYIPDIIDGKAYKLKWSDNSGYAFSSYSNSNYSVDNVDIVLLGQVGEDEPHNKIIKTISSENVKVETDKKVNPWDKSKADIIVTPNNSYKLENGDYRYYFKVESSGTYKIPNLIINAGEGSLSPTHVKGGGFNGDGTVTSSEIAYVLVDNNEYYIDFSAADVESGKARISKEYLHEGLNNGMGNTDLDAEREKEERKVAGAEWYEQIISWFIRLLGKGIQALTSLIAGEDLSIDKLVFDQYSRTNLFIFKNDAGRYGQNSLVSGALDSLNDVYRLFSEIAIAIYLIILVYMGIRMLTVSTIANKQAQYKAMLFDWVRGLIILYFFPYVMRYTILLNHAFVTYLYEQSKEIKIELAGASIKANNGALMDVIEENKNLVNDEESIEANTDKEANTSYVESMTGDGDDYMLQMYKKAEEKKRISDAVVWFIMVIQVLQFLIVYLKRLITVIFLVAIFPLVSISYAIDKIGDGKSQAFNNWTKEFILQVFIQSFHAVNYVLIMGIVISLPGTNWFLKVIGITYVAKGGEILRSLFAQMKGGTGQKPLDVAKAMIKTSVAISGVKAIGNVASRTIGRNSMLGHGIGMMSAARDTAIERQALRNEIKAHEVYRDSDTYADGTPKVPEKPLDSFIESKIRTVTDIDSTKDLTNEEKKEYNRTLEDLAKLSQEDRDRVLDQMFPDSDADSEKIKENIETKEQIRYAVYAAGIHSSLQSKKKKSKADIRREVDLELKFRSGDFADNPYIQKYFNTGRDIVDNDSEKDRLNKLNEKEIKRLEKLRAVSSVEFVKRDSRNVPMAYTSRAEQLDNLHIAMRNVNDDSIDNEQKDVYWRTILDAKGDDQLESVIEEELNGLTESARSRFEENRKTNRTRITEEALEAFGTVYAGKAAYTRDEFAFYNKIIDDAGDDIELNTRVETYDRDNVQSHLRDLRKTVDVELVNHSHDNGADFARTNEAIKRLRRDVNVDDDEGDKIITNNLRANISDLREGVLPELREERDEGLAMQEKAKKEMGNLSDIEMLGRITPENLQYLKERESELTSKFRKQLARGAATAAAGTAVSGFKLGTEVTVAGVATGATASGKSGNVLEDIITVVPNAVKATEGVLHSAGSLPSRMGNYATTKIVRDEKQTDLKIINQSMKINEKYYRNQAALDKLDRDISDAERERKDLLNKIEKKIADDSKKGKT